MESNLTAFEKLMDVGDVLDSVAAEVPVNTHLKNKCIWLSVHMHYHFFVHNRPGHVEALWHLARRFSNRPDALHEALMKYPQA